MKKNAALVLMFFLLNTGVVMAESYFHVGGGFDNMVHNKSEKSYLMFNLKGGMGYKFNANLAVELDVTAKSMSRFGGDGICKTSIDSEVNCTIDEEISRLMGVGSLIYLHNLPDNIQFFSKIGLAVINNDYQKKANAPQLGSAVFVDENSIDLAGVLSIGFIENEHHRLGVIVSTKYGSSDIGEFLFLGVEYSFLIPI